MWKYKILSVVISCSIVPIFSLIIAAGVSFIQMDISYMNPVNWDVGARILCAIGTIAVGIYLSCLVIFDCFGWGDL